MNEREKRCPTCGHRVDSIFDHIHIDCEHDDTEEEIKRKLEEAEAEAEGSVSS